MDNSEVVDENEVKKDDSNGSTEAKSNVENVENKEKVDNGTVEENESRKTSTFVTSVIAKAKAECNAEAKSKESVKKEDISIPENNDTDDKADKSKTDDENGEDTDVEKPEDKNSKGTYPTTIEELNLPGRLIHAAHRNHLTDAEVIAMPPEVRVKALETLAKGVDNLSEEYSKFGRRKRELEAVQPVKTEAKATPMIDEKLLAEHPEYAELVKPLIAEIESLRGVVGKNENAQSLKVQLDTEKQIDRFFDDVKDSFPEFGNSSTLTAAELVTRKNIWDDAYSIVKGAEAVGANMTVDEALGMSLSRYEAKNPGRARVTREAVVKEVEERSKQFVTRGSGKKNISETKTNDQKAVDVVARILHKTRGQF